MISLVVKYAGWGAELWGRRVCFQSLQLARPCSANKNVLSVSARCVEVCSVQFNEISSEAGQMASIPGYTIVSRNTFQYTMI